MFAKNYGQNVILNSAHDNISQLIRQMTQGLNHNGNNVTSEKRLKREIEYLQEDLDAISNGNVSVALKYW